MSFHNFNEFNEFNEFDEWGNTEEITVFLKGIRIEL